MVCTCGPEDPPYEEQHREFAVAFVISGMSAARRARPDAHDAGSSDAWKMQAPASRAVIHTLAATGASRSGIPQYSMDFR